MSYVIKDCNTGDTMFVGSDTADTDNMTE